MADEPRRSPRQTLRPWVATGAMLFFGALLLALLNDYYRQMSIGTSVMHLIKAIIILIVGITVAQVVKTHMLLKNIGSLSPRQRTIAGFSARLILYFGLALAVLAALGVGLSSVVFGGAFVTVVIGLAGQSMFTNILGGIWLVLFQPFQGGDMISFVTWQYPILMPSYPHEALKPVYTGRVTDINLMYTSVVTEDGDPMVIPNGILAQSAITNRTRSTSRRIRIRFEVANIVDPTELITALNSSIDKWSQSPHCELTDVGTQSYSVRVTLWSESPEDEVRHRILSSAWRTIDILTAASNAKAQGNPL